MDPITCCLLGLCCPPGSVEQFDALVKVLAQSKGVTEQTAKQAALDAWPSIVAAAKDIRARLKP